MLHAPTLPLRVRAMNGLVRLANKLGAGRIALNRQSLLEAAMDGTGLRDFGPREFAIGLDCLLQSLEDEAQLSPVGRVIARQEILMALSNRLEVIDYHKRHSDIGRGAIEKPVFIIGMGRSGTTIMHELMGRDSNLRVPQTWEVDHPFPPPDTASYASDPRIAQAQKTLDRSDIILPQFKRIHRMGATLPQECVRFTTSAFTSLIFWTNYNVPTYARWLENEADLAPAYDYHRLFLQCLQWRHNRQPWILKSPAHLWSLQELLAQYPDARFIQTHRDPLKMLASLTSLVTHLRKMSSDEVDPERIALEWAHWNALGLNASAQFRRSGLISPERVIDVDFYQFMEEPLSQMRRIYDFLDLEFTKPVEQGLQHYLAANSSEQHGSHSYEFVDTGLNLEQERERVRPYQEYFDTRQEI